VFDKLQQRIEKAAEDAKTANRNIEEAFDDPLARQTEWTPANRGGNQWLSHRLKPSGAERLTFKPTARVWLSTALPILVGAGVIVFQPVQTAQPDWQQSAFGLIFLIMGISLGYRGLKPVVIDKTVGASWSSWRSPKNAKLARDQKHCAALDDVRAVQVISERLKRTSPLTATKLI